MATRLGINAACSRTRRPCSARNEVSAARHGRRPTPPSPTDGCTSARLRHRDHPGATGPSSTSTARPSSGCSTAGRRPGDRRPQPGGRAGHRHAPPASAGRWPARPARPGVAGRLVRRATRPSSSPPCGSASPTRAALDGAAGDADPGDRADRGRPRSGSSSCPRPSRPCRSSPSTTPTPPPAARPDIVSVDLSQPKVRNVVGAPAAAAGEPSWADGFSRGANATPPSTVPPGRGRRPGPRSRARAAEGSTVVLDVTSGANRVGDGSRHPRPGRGRRRAHAGGGGPGRRRRPWRRAPVRGRRASGPAWCRSSSRRPAPSATRGPQSASGSTPSRVEAGDGPERRLTNRLSRTYHRHGCAAPRLSADPGGRRPVGRRGATPSSTTVTPRSPVDEVGAVVAP